MYMMADLEMIECILVALTWKRLNVFIAHLEEVCHEDGLHPPEG